MAKRMLLHFRRGGWPAYEKADEQGMPQPCALGQPWVNPDTQRTLAKLRIPRTDPWGRPLPGTANERVGDDPEAAISSAPIDERAGLLADDPVGERRRS